ncbi:MAG: sodium:sulfate symporter [Porticoccaceae bacterium]|nr:MAG: sodium:sulfate symporter [Porticoccaceae bacterium]
MTFQGWFTLAVVALTLAALARLHGPPHRVLLAALVALVAGGVLAPTEALAGFANEGLATVAALFVVAAGLTHSGAVDLLVHHLLGEPRTVQSAIARLALPVAAVSAFVNNTPVVAALIPAVLGWARRLQVAPSKLLIPLSYAAILGGTLTLVGTSTNLVVNGYYQKFNQGEGLSLFAITPVGLPVALVGIAFMVWWFPGLLPERRDRAPFADLRSFTLEVAVDPAGPLVGKRIAEAGLRHLGRLFLVELARGDTVLAAVSPEERLQGGDRLVFAGDTRAVADLLRIKGLVPVPEPGANPAPRRLERRLVEAVVSPRCSALGLTLREARFRDRFGAAVLAVARGGERVAGNLGTIRLRAGDTLLLETPPDFAARERQGEDFLLIQELDEIPPRHERAWLALAILAGVVAAAATGLCSMLEAALVGALATVVTGCCPADRLERSLDLPVLLAIGASLALGTALHQSGAARWLADGVLALAGDHPWLVLCLVYAAVSLLTELITNNAAALLVLPVALDLAPRTGLAEETLVIAVMMAASASFATPLGYQCNLMVYGPGGYRFADFLRVGIPMNLLAGAATLAALALREGLGALTGGGALL